AAALVGWTATLLPDWSHRDIAALTGIDRDGDYVDVEREEPGCLLAVASHRSSIHHSQSAIRNRVLADVRAGRWFGRANLLSTDHAQGTSIDEVARATEDPGREISAPEAPTTDRAPAYPARILLTRRSAVAFDGRSAIDAATFFAILSRVVPDHGAP